MDQTTHSRADRIGMGIFVAVATMAIGVLLAWLCSLAWGHWFFWPALVVSAIVVALLGGSGMGAVYERGRPKPTLRPTDPAADRDRSGGLG